jgi:hypothetical protein
MTEFDDLERDPVRDDELAAALRAIEATPQRDDAPLRDAIVAAAGPRLAGLRATAVPWWSWAGRWGRIGVPVGLAASLAASLLVVQSGDPAEANTVGAVTSSVTTVATAGSTTADELGLPVTAEEFWTSAVGSYLPATGGDSITDSAR